MVVRVSKCVMWALRDPSSAFFAYVQRSGKRGVKASCGSMGTHVKRGERPQASRLAVGAPPQEDVAEGLDPIRVAFILSLSFDDDAVAGVKWM